MNDKTRAGQYKDRTGQHETTHNSTRKTGKVGEGMAKPTTERREDKTRKTRQGQTRRFKIRQGRT